MFVVMEATVGGEVVAALADRGITLDEALKRLVEASDR